MFVRADGMKAKLMMTRDIARAVKVASLALPGTAIANGEAKFTFQTPQTLVAHQIYDLHAVVLGICVAIAAGVFAFMFYAILRLRRSVGHQSNQFTDNRPLPTRCTPLPLPIAWPPPFPSPPPVFPVTTTPPPP